jgi:hypothetical protein
MYSRAQADQGSDGSTFADDNAGTQYGRRMNPSGRLAMGMQLRYSAGNRCSRVAGAYHRAEGLIYEIVGDQETRGAGSSG